MFDWNDLKALLAVARGGSTLAAAKTLRVNQTTVARRIESLEADLGLKLFERGQGGSRLTETGLALIAEAEAVERASEGFTHQARALARGMAGVVRVTTNEVLANIALVPALSEFRRLYPGVTVDLVIGDAFLDIEKGEADVAIRGTSVLADSDLVSRKLADFEWAIYCSRDYAVRRGWPRVLAELNDHVLVGGEGALAPMPAMQWMMAKAPAAEVHCRSNSLTNLMVAAKAGLGLAPLPRLAADVDPDLFCCLEIDDFPSRVWVLTRADMRDVPRVRAFIDFLMPHFATNRRALIERGLQTQAAVAKAIAAARQEEAPA